MIEFGIFNDEGILEGQLYSRNEALQALISRYSLDDAAEVREICPDHEDQPRDTCEICTAETDESCPDICPECGYDLRDDGYPVMHKLAFVGDLCSFRWANR